MNWSNFRVDRSKVTWPHTWCFTTTWEWLIGYWWGLGDPEGNSCWDQLTFSTGSSWFQLVPVNFNWIHLISTGIYWISEARGNWYQLKLTGLASPVALVCWPVVSYWNWRKKSSCQQEIEVIQLPTGMKSSWQIQLATGIKSSWQIQLPTGIGGGKKTVVIQKQSFPHSSPVIIQVIM